MIPAKYWSPTKKLMLLGAMAGGKAVEDTATGNPLTFLTDLALPLKSLLIPFTPQQEGTGDPSPSNVRNIVPFTGCDILRMGVNLWDEEWEIGSINNDTGQNVPSNNTLRSKNYSPCIPGERYYVYHRLNGSDMRLHWYRKDKTFISSSWRNVGSCTAPDDAYYFRLRMAASYGTKYKNDIGINYPYTQTSYKAYTGNNAYSVMFPSPVYGGTLDVVSGVLTVEWVSLTKTWGDFSNKTSLGDNTRGTLNISAYPSKPSIQAVDAKCNIAPRGTGWSTDSVHFYTNEGSCVVFLPNDTDASTEIQVVYPLATQQEITLTPEQITALLGENTIWSDANGTMSAVYLKKA